MIFHETLFLRHSILCYLLLLFFTFSLSSENQQTINNLDTFNNSLIIAHSYYSSKNVMFRCIARKYQQQQKCNNVSMDIINA